MRPKTLVKKTLVNQIIFLYPLVFLVLLCGPVLAHEDDTSTVTLESFAPVESEHLIITPCITEWCDASWPPEGRSDRTIGKDNCGNTCIKIAKEVKNTSIIVTLSTDEKGKPVMKASCPIYYEK